MNKRLTILLSLILVGILASYLLINPTPTPGTNSEQSSSEPTLPPGVTLKAWNTVDDFDKNLVQFETVFWDPRDSISLRKLIRESGLVKDKSVMEIGCGSGLIGLCCLKAGAQKVVVTDVNKTAITNAKFNATWLGLNSDDKPKFEARLVQLDDSGAFSTLQPDEKFDLIISNPPWVNQKPETIDEYALYDENFNLMRTLFDGIEKRLKPGGRVWLAYGCVDAIRTMKKMAEQRNFHFEILDDRKLADLNEEFLPGMLIEIKPSPKP